MLILYLLKIYFPPCNLLLSLVYYALWYIEVYILILSKLKLELEGFRFCITLKEIFFLTWPFMLLLQSSTETADPKISGGHLLSKIICFFSIFSTQHSPFLLGSVCLGVLLVLFWPLWPLPFPLSFDLFSSSSAISALSYTLLTVFSPTPSSPLQSSPALVVETLISVE